MKKKIFIGIFSVLHFFAFCINLDLYSTKSVRFKEDTLPEFTNSIFGVKFKAPYTLGKFYLNEKNALNFAIANHNDEKYKFMDSDFSYGVSFDSEKLLPNFPLLLRFGKLSNAGTISLLNNPLIYSGVSPFSSISTSIKGISSSLPSASNFSKVPSIFTQGSYKFMKDKNLLPEFIQKITLNGFYDFSNNFGTSLLANFSFPNKIKLSAQYTFASFLYDAVQSDSWFSDKKFYHGGRINCSSFQILFSQKYFTSIFTTEFYPSPFGELKSIFKTENRFKNKNFIINLSALFNPYNETITSSEKIINECVQLKAGFQFLKTQKFTFPIFWKTGTTFYSKINLYDTENDFKISAGVQMTSFITSASFVAQCDFSSDATKNYKSEFSKQSATLKNFWYFEKLKPGLKFSQSLEAGKNFSYWKTTESITAYLSFCENPVISIQAGGSFSQKTSDDSTESKLNSIDIGTSIKFSSKYFNCYGKVEISFK